MVVATETRGGRAQSRRRTPQYYHDILYTNAERNARVLLRSIKANLAQATYFQREDLLQLPIFAHITTIARYGTIRIACLFLIDEGALISLSRTDLALPGKAKSYSSEHPLHEEYLDTIRAVVRAMRRGQPFAVMDVVSDWRADGHLSINSKRVAVRHAMTQLVKEKVCRRRNEFEYTV